jgi:hypothetical protein
MLVKPEEGSGRWDKHFWMLVKAIFHHQQQPTVTELIGEMLDHENVGKYDQILSQLDMRSLQYLSLRFIYEDHLSPDPNRALVNFLKRALTSDHFEYLIGIMRVLRTILHSYQQPEYLITPCTGCILLNCLSLVVLSPSHLQKLLLRYHNHSVAGTLIYDPSAWQRDYL